MAWKIWKRYKHKSLNPKWKTRKVHKHLSSISKWKIQKRHKHKSSNPKWKTRKAHTQLSSIPKWKIRKRHMHLSSIPQFENTEKAHALILNSQMENTEQAQILNHPGEVVARAGSLSSLNKTSAASLAPSLPSHLSPSIINSRVFIPTHCHSLTIASRRDHPVARRSPMLGEEHFATSWV